MRVKLANQVFAFNTLWVVITVTAFAILINLSWWQLSRASEKTDQLARLAQLQADGAIAPADLALLAVADDMATRSLSFSNALQDLAVVAHHPAVLVTRAGHVAREGDGEGAFVHRLQGMGRKPQRRQAGDGSERGQKPPDFQAWIEHGDLQKSGCSLPPTDGME